MIYPRGKSNSKFNIMKNNFSIITSIIYYQRKQLFRAESGTSAGGIGLETDLI